MYTLDINKAIKMYHLNKPLFAIQCIFGKLCIE